MSLTRSVNAVILSILLSFSFILPSQAQQQRLLGLDISAWQGNISQTTWNNIRNVENRQFVVLRSSRGGTTGYYNQSDAANANGQNTLSQRYDDPYFVQNVNRASAAGMFVGCYHFSRPDIIASTLNANGIPNNGADEADHFIQMAGAFMRPGYLPPVHDLEAGISQRTSSELAQFFIDFSNRVYERMGIRPAVYTGGNYVSYLQSASASLRAQIPVCYPILWTARWPNQSNPNAIDVQNAHPKDSYSGFYGPWDVLGSHPWAFWQYASTVRLQSFNSGGSNLDANVAQGGVEFIKDRLVPALWINDIDGSWTTLTNWNSGLPPIVPVTGSGQVAPVGTQTLPTPRLPSTNDTIVLDRPNTNITVTLVSGTHNIRKLYVRETLNITGGALNLNYTPSWDSTPNAAQFSAPVTLSGSGSLRLHTLQVDTNQTFTLDGGTLTFFAVKLMPHSTTPATIAMTGDMNLNSFSNATAVIGNGIGSGISGSMDLSGATRSFNIGSGTDLFVDVPVSNGGITKAGPGTLRLNTANTYSGSTIVSAGTLLVNNSSGSGTGSGNVTVNAATLRGTGTISGAVTINNGAILAPGTASSIGTLTLNTVPILNGTTMAAVDRNGGSPVADKVSLSSGTLNFGGLLVVSNAGTPLIGGEVFTICAAANYSGSFTATNLPALGAGLNWYMENLDSNGTIIVNRDPVANLLTYTSAYPATLQIPIADLVASVTDPDGNLVTLDSINLTTTNGVTLTTNSTHVFYSNNVDVSDRFFFTVSDGRGGSAIGTVDILSLTGIEPCAITTHPLSRTNLVGTTATFSVVASGTTPTYLWRKGNITLSNDGRISGATSATLTISTVSPGDATNYTVVVSNILGSVTSSPASLFVLDPPVITTQPQSATVTAGQNVTFTARASGGEPLSYQWRFQGTPLAGSTTTNLILTNVSVLHAGNYDLLVTNFHGSATSQVAVLTVNPAPPGRRLELLWRLAPYSRPYLTTNDLPYERGMTYNPITHHVLVASRSNRVYVVNADTGGHLYELNMTGVTGGQYPLLLVHAADDGVIYAGNLNTSSVAPNFRLYRWANDNSNTIPTLAYSGDPSPGTGQRWGDSLDVRGAGTNTQVLLTPRAGTIAAILTTTNGLNFTSRSLSLTDTPTGHTALGLCFGAGNTFWGTTHTNQLRRITFDLNAGTGITTRLYTSAEFPINICPIAFSPSLNIIAGVHVFSPNDLRIYQLDLTNGPPVLIGSTNFASNNSNTHTGAGAVRFGGDTVYALDANNGLMAVRLAPVIAPPVIASQPQSLTVTNGQTAAFNVTATGTEPLSYQWFFNGNTLFGATASSLLKTNVALTNAGNYNVIVANAGGWVTSIVATLNVEMLLRFDGLTFQPGQPFSLRGTGNPGSYIVEATSTPFTNWITLTNITVDANGTFEIVDPVAGAAQRFYRLSAP